LSLRQVGEEYIAPTTQIEQELCTIWSEVLRIEKIGIHDNFFKIGGDSIISIQIVAKARQKDIHLAVKDIFNHPTIADLTLVAQAQEDTLTLKPEQGTVTGDIPLTPIQHYFFEQQLKNPHHYNQAMLLQVNGPLNPALLRQAFEQLIRHHDALRCRYHYEETWKQENLNHEDIGLVWSIIDLSHIPNQDLPIQIEQQATLLQQSLIIETGPLLKVALFDCGLKRPARLLIAIHHLVVDGVSWRILLEDLNYVYQNQTPTLPSKTHSYQQWGQALVAYAQSEELKQQIPYWQTIEQSLQPLPIDFNKGPHTGTHTDTIALALTPEETTALLQRVPKAYRTQINDILLAALVLAVGDWTQNYSLSLSLEGHGRENIIKDIDLSRTVGWFTSIFPVYLSVEDPSDLGEIIKTVKETLRQIPDKGIGYGILKYLTQEKPLSAAPVESDPIVYPPHAHPSLSFNYLGQWDNTLAQEELFGFARESAGCSIALENTSTYLLNINCEVRQGILQLFWSYSTHHYQSQTIQSLAQAFAYRLKQIIHHCSQEENFGYTPSDFNLLSLSQFALDKNFGCIPLIESIYPLSPMQSGLLFQALYAPTSDAYFVQTIFELEGELDIQALRSTWQLVCDHHPILRTGFIWEKLETPLQYVLETTQLPFTELDWTGLTEDEQQEIFEEFIQEDRQRGFDLRKAPLFRITLIRCSQDKCYMLWSQHHILTDGWCLPILLGDVFKTYAAIKQRKEPQLALRRPYRDYIAWLQQQDMEEAKTFWKKYLCSIEEPTRLSFKGLVEPNEKDYENYSVVLSLEETDRLKHFAQDNGLTLNTVIQGAVGLVLKAYTGQAEPVMGVTVSGRNIDFPGIEEMVGIFINTLPLKVSPQPEDSVLSFLTNLQEDAQKLNEYAYTPLAQIQNWSNIHQSLFNVIFVFENYPIGENVEPRKDSFRIKGVQGIEKTEYPLTVVIGPGRQLHISLAYQTVHFNEAYIQKLSGHIHQILRGILQSQESDKLITTLQDLSLLTSAEKQQILIEWNDTKADYPKNKTIHQLFEEQVEKTPDNIAVVFEDQELTYQQLNEKANQLAHYLRTLGVGPDTLVAIAVERSLEMIIGLLGILKAGGAYVPLDPDYPQERLQFMLDDTQASVLITHSQLQDKLKETLASYSGQTVILDQTEHILQQQETTTPLPLALP
ncbi:AMP-binding protein, partial [bacterium]